MFLFLMEAGVIDLRQVAELPIVIVFQLFVLFQLPHSCLPPNLLMDHANCLHQ